MGGEIDPGRGIRDGHRPDRQGQRLAALAAQQHGVVGQWQLVELGYGRDRISRLTRAGRLHRLHARVYAVGHTGLSRLGWWMAAVLRGGAGSVLSHRPAGAAWDLRSFSGRPAITVPGARLASRPGLEIHASLLPDDEVTLYCGIPITSVPRTLLDLATLLQPHELRNAVARAEAAHRADALSLPALLQRHFGERGTARLRAVLATAGYGVAEEGLEERFSAFVASRGLPPPELNAWIEVAGEMLRPDCLWRPQRLIVELHSARYHSGKLAVSRDAGRDRRLLLAGWRVIHVTWAQLSDRAEADALERDLRIALAA